MPAIHRETLKAALRVIATCETLDQARTQLSRLLGVFDKLSKAGLSPDKALAEAAGRGVGGAATRRRSVLSRAPGSC
jgi:hypothetical protein